MEEKESDGESTVSVTRQEMPEVGQLSRDEQYLLQAIRRNR